MSKTNMAEYMRNRRLKRRLKIIELLGGKCVVCGTETELQVDHIKANTKVFILSGHNLDKKWETILEEASKCQLLCAKHHILKTNENLEHNGGHNVINDHGTEAMYVKGCRCDPCKAARYHCRVRRGETSGIRTPQYAIDYPCKS